MWNNDYLSLINFKVKPSSSENFFKRIVVCSNLFVDIENMVSRGVLERHLFLYGATLK